MDEKKRRLEEKHNRLKNGSISCFVSVLLIFMAIGALKPSREKSFVILGIMGVLMVIGIVLTAMDSYCKESLYEIYEEERKERAKKRASMESDYGAMLVRLGVRKKIVVNQITIGYGSGRLFFLDGNDKSQILNYANKDNSEKSEQEYSSLKKYIYRDSVEVENVDYYYKEGDLQYTTSISGGGGGGSSIKGAIVGGIIAGDTGAIIGSRRKNEEIKTIENKHDSRKTIIRYKLNNTSVTKSFDGFEAYDFFLKNVPEKDLMYLQVSEKNEPVKKTVDYKSSEENDAIENKLMKIKDLYEKGLIDEEDYKKKKTEILESV